MTRILTFLLIFFPISALSAETTVQVEHRLSKALHLNIINVSSGRLDSTPDQYHSALVTNKDEILFLYLIRETANGATEINNKIDLGGAGSRTNWTTKIRKESIFVGADSSGGCCSHGGSTYQFKLNQSKRLIMIGFDELNIGERFQGDLSDRRIFSEDHFSVNLLTGDAIRKHAESAKIETLSEKANFFPAWRQFKLLAPIKKTTHRFRISFDKQWSLEDLESSSKDGESFIDWKFKIYKKVAE